MSLAGVVVYKVKPDAILEKSDPDVTHRSPSTLLSAYDRRSGAVARLAASPAMIPISRPQSRRLRMSARLSCVAGREPRGSPA